MGAFAGACSPILYLTVVYMGYDVWWSIYMEDDFFFW
jgi:hypothetical protein